MSHPGRVMRPADALRPRLQPQASRAGAGCTTRDRRWVQPQGAHAVLFFPFDPGRGTPPTCTKATKQNRSKTPRKTCIVCPIHPQAVRLVVLGGARAARHRHQRRTGLVHAQKPHLVVPEMLEVPRSDPLGTLGEDGSERGVPLHPHTRGGGWSSGMRSGWPSGRPYGADDAGQEKVV